MYNTTHNYIVSMFVIILIIIYNCCLISPGQLFNMDIVDYDSFDRQVNTTPELLCCCIRSGCVFCSEFHILMAA